MEYREFTECMTELCDFYGDKAYMPRTAALIWQIVQPLSKGEFSQVILTLTETHMKPPNPATIRATALGPIRRAQERAARLEIAALDEREIECKACLHSGLVLAYERKDLRQEYSFRCPFCSAATARRLSESIPRWSKEKEQDFLLVSIKPESFAEARRQQRAAYAEGIAQRLKADLKKTPEKAVLNAIDALAKKGLGFDLSKMGDSE
jgi:hypothetical protein